MTSNGRGFDWGTAVAAGVVFVGTLVLRLSTISITNDDYLHLALAHQLLLGGLPFRDFIDPGELLFNYTSAGVQLLLGANMLSEAILDTTGMALGYTLVFLMARRASASTLLALVVTVVAVLLLPRPYGYPKILVHAVGLWLIWRYADRRSAPALVATAVWTALAFLFRHDYGLYVGVAAAAMFLLLHGPEGGRVLADRAWRFGAAAAVLVLPFLVFVQLHGGVVSHVRNTLQTARGEYVRTVDEAPSFALDWSGWIPMPVAEAPRIKVRWVTGIAAVERQALESRFGLAMVEPDDEWTWYYELGDTSARNIEAFVTHASVADTDGVDRTDFFVTNRVEQPNAIAWFYYLTLLLPPLAIIVVLLPGTPGAGPVLASERAKVLTTAVLAFVMQGFLLRAASDVAVADVSVPSAVLGAWLLGRGLVPGGPRTAWRAWRESLSGGQWPRVSWLAVRAVPALAVLFVTVAASAAGEGGFLVARRFYGAFTRHGLEPFAERLGQLRRSSAPFEDEVSQYLAACTTPGDRVLVTGYAPHVFYQSGRGFAAGRPYFLTSLAPGEGYEAFSLARWKAEQVPVVLETGDVEDFERGYPMLSRHLREQYVPTGVSLGEFTVLVERDRRPESTYRSPELPCFAASAGRSSP